MYQLLSISTFSRQRSAHNYSLLLVAEASKMKVRYLTNLSIASSSYLIVFNTIRCCHAWSSPQLKYKNSFRIRYSSHKLQAQRMFSLNSKTSTITSEDEALFVEQTKSIDGVVSKIPESSIGKTIAEGTIVSYDAGGLFAVLISENFSEDEVTKVTPTSDANLVTPKTLSVKVEVGDYQGKKVLFSNGSSGVVIAHRPPLVFVYSNSLIPFKENENVKIKEAVAVIEVNPSIHVVDCFGHPIGEFENVINKDSLSPEIATKRLLKRVLFSPIPQVKDIALINNPMLTGITMVDTLASIGRGQNMLLVGHNLDSMRKFVGDYLITQTKRDTSMCIYAATEEFSDDVLKRLQNLDIENQVQLVASRKQKQIQIEQIDNASKMAEAIVIAATACAIGESYALEGQHALVIIDTIDLHKTFWDYTTRVMINEFGVDSVVKSDRDGGASSEMRGFFSSLVQRSAQYKHGGSVTLLLLVTIPAIGTEDEDTIYNVVDFENSPMKVKERIELLVKKQIPLSASTLRKINIPIPSVSEGIRRFALQHVDELISMSDGQIWLDESLEELGRQPPIDPQRSVTRIGIGADTQSQADAPALRRIVEGLRLELSQATDVLSGVDMSHAAQIQNRRQLALLLAMHQKFGSGGRRLSESCIVLLAAQNGLLDKFVVEGALPGTPKGDQLISDLLFHVQQEANNIMDHIDKTFDMTDSEQNLILISIRNFLK